MIPARFRTLAVLCCASLLIIGCNQDPPGEDGSDSDPDAGPESPADTDPLDDGGPSALDAADGSGDPGEDADPPADSTSNTDSSSADGESIRDTAPDISCSPGLTPCQGECVDIDTSDTHCGECGRSCGSLGTCEAGSCRCPRYHEYCPGAGSCVPTNLDPDNCGSCGNECTGDTYCSGGACLAECPTGLDSCPDQNECVDFDTSNENCGTCGNTCTGNTACVNGTCQQATGSPTIPGSNKCVGGGPPIDVGIGDSSDGTCTGDVAQDTFRWGLCTCESVNLKNNSIFDAYDSTLGPYNPPPLGGGGSVGSNGSLTAEKNTIVTGSLWSTGPAGITISKTEIREQLHAGNSLTASTGSSVEGDAFVEGAINASGGGISFGQTLFVNQLSDVPNQIASNTDVVETNVSVSDPCSRCQSQNQIPVGQIVSDHSNPSDNDNGLINLDPAVLNNPGQETRLDLPCGEYYLDEVNSSSRITIVAHGRTVLYIGGDVQVPTDSIIKPTPSAELDIFVDGDMVVNGGVNLGSPAYPASTRAYVGGPNGFQLENDATIGANIYAIPGGFDAKNNPEIFGSVYAESFETMNNAEIHYDRQTLSAGESCPDPDDPGDGDDGGADAGLDAGLDAGSPSDAGPTTDAFTPVDGGQTDAGDGNGGTCSEQGQSCSSDGDCCTPLVCNTNTNTCEASSCNYLYESCSADSDCCSGNCASTSDGMICFGG